MKLPKLVQHYKGEPNVQVIRYWIRRKGEEEFASDDSLEALARDVKDLKQERQTRLKALFQRLKILDAEVARQALDVFGDRARRVLARHGPAPIRRPPQPLRDAGPGQAAEGTGSAHPDR